MLYSKTVHLEAKQTWGYFCRDINFTLNKIPFSYFPVLFKIINSIVALKTFAILNSFVCVYAYAFIGDFHTEIFSKNLTSEIFGSICTFARFNMPGDVRLMNFFFFALRQKKHAQIEDYYFMHKYQVKTTTQCYVKN